MKSLVALALLGQILGCIAQLVSLESPIQFPDCDSPEVEHVAAIAVDYINSKTVHGFKQVLNRIEKVKVLNRRPHGKIWYLELDLLETTCHVFSAVPAENCTVRSLHDHAVEGDCDVKIISMDGDYKVLATRCHSSPDSAEDIKKFCPRCGTLSALDDAGVVNAANVALSKFNAENTTVRFYRLHEISRGKHVPLPLSVVVEFAIVATNCSTQEALNHVEDCQVESGENAHYGFCGATVSQRPVIPDQPPSEDVDVHCTLFGHQGAALQALLAQHHLRKDVLPPAVGRTVHNLIHFHNNTLASHESNSAEKLTVASPVVKRAVVASEPGPVGTKLPCPGRVRHFRT
ncbi:alpha-2-HS-glycoprotein [Elgaria multicarinata webbii]|uniref:alpha-2-HS-glycoprotein n=1 Tax=Elgaria multicarinata webbii TaxID=159646 RepID=UPI002FCD2FEF